MLICYYTMPTSAKDMRCYAKRGVDYYPRTLINSKMENFYFNSKGGGNF